MKEKIEKTLIVGVLFTFDSWDFIRGVSEVVFQIVKMIFLPFWWFWLLLLMLGIFRIVFVRWINKRRGRRIDSKKTGRGLNNLEKLANLRDRNIITEEEFQKKKMEIFKR